MSLQLHQHPMAAIVYRSLLDTSMLWEMGREGTKCTLSKSHHNSRHSGRKKMGSKEKRKGVRKRRVTGWKMGWK